MAPKTAVGGGGGRGRGSNALPFCSVPAFSRADMLEPKPTEMQRLPQPRPATPPALELHFNKATAPALGTWLQHQPRVLEPHLVLGLGLLGAQHRRLVLGHGAERMAEPPNAHLPHGVAGGKELLLDGVEGKGQHGAALSARLHSADRFDAARRLVVKIVDVEVGVLGHRRKHERPHGGPLGVVQVRVDGGGGDDGVRGAVLVGVEDLDAAVGAAGQEQVAVERRAVQLLHGPMVRLVLEGDGVREADAHLRALRAGSFHDLRRLDAGLVDLPRLRTNQHRALQRRRLLLHAHPPLNTVQDVHARDPHRAAFLVADLIPPDRGAQAVVQVPQKDLAVAAYTDNDISHLLLPLVGCPHDLVDGVAVLDDIGV
mmetsp:Transcript_52317/g.85958  ORF Transcript_52317/g.85958 Transcript_52317/m.85958 type:complete len:371 (-) Transcript_52317:854-1966(-)